MKKLSLFLLAAILMVTLISGCKKPIVYGNVTFWCAQNEGTVTVTMNGQAQVITGYVTGGVPNCGNAVSANFTLPEGTYNYSAVSTNTFTWSGTAVVIGDNCELYQLQ